jgi:hypothetical protein
MAAPPQGSPSEQHEVASEAAGAPRRRGAASGARRRRGQLDGRASRQGAPWPWPDGGWIGEPARGGSGTPRRPSAAVPSGDLTDVSTTMMADLTASGATIANA